MSNTHRLILFLSLLWSPLAMSSPVTDTTFVNAEQQMSAIAAKLSESRFKDAIQDSLAHLLHEMLGGVLKNEGSFEYPFDSLKNDVSIVKSSDGRLRLLTWFTVGDAGDYHYYGFLQYDDRSAKKLRLYNLVDNSDALEKTPNLENQTLSPQNWYGSLYYSIVEKKGPDGIVYTLLGWDGNGLYTSKKIVEPLVFTEKGQPKFGKLMIKYDRKKAKRLIFEFSKRVTMMVQYDANLDMIVFDHLTDFGERSTGNPMFLGPDMSYDALKFEDGMWLYQSNVTYQRPKAGKRR